MLEEIGASQKGSNSEPAYKKAKKIVKPVEIQMVSTNLLSGPATMLWPRTAQEFGIAGGVVLSQLYYLTKYYRDQKADNVNYDDGDNYMVRISASKLQRQLPFYSTRQIRRELKRLVDRKAIITKRTIRVNEIYLKHFDWVTPETDYNMITMLVFPGLAQKAGVLGAIALQQIHLKCRGNDGTCWMPRSLKRWHEYTFIFAGERTVKRVFKRLKEQGLIYTIDKRNEEYRIKSYRVNYLKVAEVLGIPVPIVEPPEPKWGSKGNSKYKELFISPLCPLDCPIY